MHLECATTIGRETPWLLISTRGALVLVDHRSGAVCHEPPRPQQLALPHGSEPRPCSARTAFDSFVPRLMMYIVLPWTT
tara:strand:- start:174 stop:410 length:237 start_codon:yes stop_codon:yes gene_type:complete